MPGKLPKEKVLRLLQKHLSLYCGTECIGRTRCSLYRRGGFNRLRTCPCADKGNPCSKIGNARVKTGNTHVKTGNTFVETGNAFAKTGNALVETRNAYIADCRFHKNGNPRKPFCT